MQAFVALPRIEHNEPADGGNSYFRGVSGVPLLARVLGTAANAGVTSVLLVQDRSVSEAQLREGLASYKVPLPEIQFVALESAFKPDDRSHWEQIAHYLEANFLWLPWNFVTTKKTLAAFIAQAGQHPRGAWLAVSGPPGQEEQLSPELGSPLVVDKKVLLDAPAGQLSNYPADPLLPSSAAQGVAGVAVDSAGAVREAERLLVRGSGKPTDGVHSNFNRRLTWPAVRWLTRTPITANMITFAGLPVAMLAGYFYSLGEWSAYVAGGLFYFTSVLFDEMDGMIARIKFQESPFGCKLEDFVDFITYIFLWSGMAIGLYRERGELWLWMGAAILVGTVMSVIMQAVQRKIAAPPDRPQDMVKIVYERFEADSGNPISWISRKLHFLTKKGAMCHYVVWFSVLGLLPAFFTLSTIGSNCLWMGGFYANRFFRSPAPAKS